MARVYPYLLAFLLVFCVSCGNKATQAENNGYAEINPENVIEIIKKVNVGDKTVLSFDFQNICNDLPLFEYGALPDRVKVSNPDIKILKYIQNGDSTQVTVIFDFIDHDAPHMGWISRDKICGLKFIQENGNWVADDYLEAWNSSLDDFFANANSMKGEANFEMELRAERRKEIRLQYQPRLQEYSYSFDSTLVSQSADMTNGDWEVKGFTGSENTLLNKLAGAQFDGIDISELYGANQTSELYDSIFRNKTTVPQEANQSIRLNIFRHPQSGMPMIAINGQLINANRMNIYAHEGGKTVEMSFQCLAEHPILDLNNEDADYPKSIPLGLFVYQNKRPFYWYPKYIKNIKRSETPYFRVDIGDPDGYSEDNLYWANKKIEELKNEEGRKWEYYQAIRKKEAIDPENNDYNKYFYIDVTIHNCDENPSVSLNFDNREFALVCTCNRPKISEIDPDEIMDVEQYAFGTYSHKVVANNSHLDPTDIGGSVTASNLGLYGKSEVARQEVEIGWDTYIDGKIYGRIFETIKLNNGYRFNLFRDGKPYQIETIEIPSKAIFKNKITITYLRQVGHLELVDNYDL